MVFFVLIGHRFQKGIHTMDFNSKNAYIEIVLLLMDSVKYVKEQLLVKYISQVSRTDIDTYLGQYRSKIQSLCGKEALDILFPRGGITNVEEWDMSMLDLVFTQLQKDLLLECVRSSGMDLKQVLQTHRQGIGSSNIGQTRGNAFSAQNPDVTFWTMPMLCVVLKIAFPQDMNVPLHCAIDATHTIRNTLVHCKKASVDKQDYKKFTSEIDQLIENTKKFLKDPEFDKTIQSSVDKIKQKCSAMSLPDAIVALNNWATAQNEIEKKLDQQHEENIDQHHRTQAMISDALDRLTRMERASDRRLPVDVLVEIEGQSNLRQEELDGMHRRIVQLINDCIEMKGTTFDNQQRDSINESVCQVLRDLPQNGIRIVGAENRCIVLRVQCQSIGAFSELYEASLSGELTKWFTPLENGVRTSWHASYTQTVTLKQEMVPEIIQNLAIELSKNVFDENIAVFNCGRNIKIALPCVDMLYDLGTANALIHTIQSHGPSANIKATRVDERKAAYSKHLCEKSGKWHGFRNSCVYVEEISQSFYALLDKCQLNVQNEDRKKYELQLLGNVRKQNCSVEIVALSNTIKGIRMFEKHLKFTESNTDIANIPQQERMTVVITLEYERHLLQTFLADHKESIHHVCVVFINENEPEVPYVQPDDFGVQCFICQTRPELISNSIGVLLERNVMHFLRSQVQTLLFFREQVDIKKELETTALKEMFKFLSTRFEIVFDAKAMETEESSSDTDVYLHLHYKDLRENASLIHNVLQKASGLYKRRKTRIPEEEREEIQDRPNPVREVSERLLHQTFPHVITYGIVSETLLVYVDDMVDENIAQHLAAIFAKLLKREAAHYKVVFAKLKQFGNFSCGSEVCNSSQTPKGTLGGFVEHTYQSSTSICAITARHSVSSKDNEFIVDGTCIGTLLAIEQFDDVDIAAAKIFDEFVPKCQLAFKDSEGDAKPCKLYDSKSRDIDELHGLHVHIWGASSKPGTGFIAGTYFRSDSSSTSFFVTDSTGRNEPFARPGDSGAIVVSESIDDNSMTAIGIVLGKMVELNSTSEKETEKGLYICSFLQVGLDQLSKAHKGTFALPNDVK